MTRYFAKALVLLISLPALAGCASVTPTPAATAQPAAATAPVRAGTATFSPTMPPPFTPAPTASATPSPTPTPHPALAFAEPLLAAVAQVPPFFADDFSINRGWGQRLDGQLQVREGVVKATGQGGKFLPPHVDSFAQRDFVLALDVRLLNAETQFGAVFRQRHSRPVSYAFYLGPGGDWLFESVKRIGNGDAAPTYIEQVIATGSAPNFRPAELNHLVILARGSQFAAYLNGLPLMYAEDEAQTLAGLCVNIGFSGGAQGAEGEFDNLQFWDLEQVRLP
jgi:hypothetical protein